MARTPLTLALVVFAASCGGDSRPTMEGPLGELVAAGDFTVGGAEHGGGAPLRFDSDPILAEVTVDDESRPAVITALGSWTWRGRVPRNARLALGAHGLVSEGEESGLVVTVRARAWPEKAVLARATVSDGRWLDLDVDLERFAGRRVTLEVEARRVSNQGELRPSAQNRDGTGATGGDGDGSREGEARVAWAPVAVRGSRVDQERPNIVVILVDTVRADRLGIYGHGRATDRQIERHLVRRGVVVEQAYAPSSWTLPSILTLFASRWPGDLLGEDVFGHALPESAPSLPAVLQQSGYATGGFVANPIVHRGIGFARGFETFYTPADVSKALFDLHAGDLAHRAARWVAAQGDRPFFLYAHFLDPHDPYESPDLIVGGRSRRLFGSLTKRSEMEPVHGGRSPFYSGYQGTLTGRDVHGLFLGQISLQDPEEDLRHLLALYDSEIAWVDRFVGELLASLPRQVARHTLFVLTSDHGEEFFERGGWKHGRTLYEEQIRVPLVLRWDGVLPAGRRASGPVRLIDLAPTLAVAAGAAIPREWQGKDLLPMLTGVEPEISLPVFSQHLSGGPARAAVVLDGWKLMVFDRHQPFDPPNPEEEALWRQELDRLERIELYHLPRDPGERENLASLEPRRVRRLSPTLHGRLGGHLPGLRILLSGVEPEVVVKASVTFEHSPESWDSYFMGPGDEVEIDGRVLRLTLRGEALEKGVRVQGAVGGIEAVEILEGPALVVALGRDRVLPEQGASPEELRWAGWPGTPAAPALLLWAPEEAPAAATGRLPDAETMRRLQALGYAG